MSNFPRPGDRVQVRVITQLLTQVGMNVLHMTPTTVTTGGASLQEIANALDTALAPLYKPAMTSNSSWRGVGCQNITAPRSLEYFSVANTGPGTGATPPMGAQVCGVITYKTTNAGPSWRGRSYIAFPPGTASQTTGIPTASYTTLLAAIATAILAPGTVVGATGSTAFRFGVLQSATDIVQFYASATVPSKWATQKRRGNYGRPNALPF